MISLQTPRASKAIIELCSILINQASVIITFQVISKSGQNKNGPFLCLRSRKHLNVVAAVQIWIKRILK